MKNKEQIFNKLMTENKDRIYRLCHAYLYDQNEVQDLYQDIWLNIWRNLHTFRGEASWSTWVYRIAVNTALAYNKRNRRRRNVFSGENPAHDALPAEDVTEEKMEKEKALDHLAWCISQLEKQDRLIITMLLEGMAYKEIAAVLGISPNHVGVKINRIKKKLSNMMKTKAYEF